MIRYPGLLIHVVVAVSCLSPAQATVVFVDGRVADCGDGASWATAYKHLQDALAAARNSGGTITEIWVAAGTYRPDRDCAHPTGTGDRIATFALVDGVALRGGFSGTEDPALFDLNSRDFDANVTVLSGDLAGDDGPDFSNNGENSYHVVSAVAVGPPTILDGFTVSRGNANDTPSASPDRLGGGVYLKYECHLTMSNCLVKNNRASFGGGMYYASSSLTLIKCTFDGNATDPTGWGGAIYGDLGSNPTFKGCTFTGNRANDGGGMANFSSNPALVNCVFSGNLAGSTGRGGGTYNSLGSHPVFTNCTFSGNRADSGGGVYNIYGSAALVNCVLWGNGGSQVFGSADITYSCIEGGWTGAGNIDMDPVFVGGEDLRLRPGSPCIDAGSNAAVPEEVVTDLDGRARFRNDPATADCRWAPGTCGAAPIVDMGAYEYIPGDFDRDGDIDADDASTFLGCASGPSVPYGGDCVKADLDGDGDVDQVDFGILQSCYSGLGREVDPRCSED